MDKKPVILEYVEKEYERKKAHPTLIERILDHTYYPVYRFIADIPYKIRWIKWGYQRMRYGISDRDCWGLNSYISDITYRGIEYIKKYKHVIPSDFMDGCEFEEGEKKWHAVLDDIAYAFKVEKSTQEWTEWIIIRDKTERETFDKDLGQRYKEYYYVMNDEEIARYDRGWQYFLKYYQSLWD